MPPQPITIERADDPRLTEYADLRNRADGGRYLIAESELVVQRLVTSPFPLRSLLLTPKRFERMKGDLAHIDAPVYLVSREVMQQVAGFKIHRGVLASAERITSPSLADIVATARRILVMEGSNDHENIGAVARSARALGFDAMVLDPTCADPYARRSVRVSMGEVLHLPVVRTTTWPDPIDALHEAGFQTWSLTPSTTAQSLFAMAVPDRLAIIAGAEGPGLLEATRQRTHFDVRIPMHHGVDSLNLGHALAIAMAATSPIPAS